MIPKIIHQLWIGPRPAPLELMKTWQTKHPDWEYIFWDETRLEAEFPEGLRNQAQYDEMPELNGKCDIARLEILNRFGGVFIDADSRCLRPLEDFLLETEAFSCYENEINRRGLIACGVMGSVPDSEFTSVLIGEIAEKSGNRLWKGPKSAWKTVGPGLVTDTVRKYSMTSLTVYPSHYFIPSHHTGSVYKGKGIVFAEHYWGSTPNSGYEYE